MDLEITKNEIEAIKAYKNEKYIPINLLLEDDIETDIELYSGENVTEYSKENVKENVEVMKHIFKAFSKSKKIPSEENKEFFKVVNIAEIEKLKINSYLNKMWLVYSSQSKAEQSLTNTWGRYALLKINCDQNLVYANLSSILENADDQFLISPFIKINSIKEIDIPNENEILKTYQIDLVMQELDSIPDEESEKLYQEILENVDTVNSKLKACSELDEEISIHYENIRKLEQLLAKHNFAMEQENYDIDTTDAEKQSDIDDIARINLELSNLKNEATKIFEIRKENVRFISDWKKDIAVFLMSEWKKMLDKPQKENENILEETGKNSEENDSQEVEKEEKSESKEIITLSQKLIEVKQECNDNIEMVGKLLENIKSLISKQQNHARIAGEMDSNYKALNNAFEMRNYAEELESLIQAISTKVDNLSSENEDELEKISKVNIQISTLMNYLNNPKSAVSKKLKRFDEISIIEENELKREIAETLKNIRCEAELKKLNDDIDIIEDQSKIKKFFGRFIGRNKLDKVKLEQIGIRQNAIRKTFKTKMPLAHNYSMHELIAEIEMFIEENSDDELVLEDVNHLRKLEGILKKNFVIIDGKVKSIVDRKNGKNLPISSKKISKAELIEIDTYRFLNKYGYDKSNDFEEPVYQDTLASEIKRIVDYVKSSGVL